MELGLSGKAVVVTGGSRGIGLETARLFAREGARVLIAARRESALAEAAAACDVGHNAGHRESVFGLTCPFARRA